MSTWTGSQSGSGPSSDVSSVWGIEGWPGHPAFLTRVFVQLPSNATVSRFFECTVINPELFSSRFETLTRQLRTGAWNAAGERNVARSVTAADPLIVDVDAIWTDAWVINSTDRCLNP